VTSKVTPAFWRLFRALPVDVQRQARDAFRIFSRNPNYPSLRFKRVHPTQPIYSARVGARHRAIGVLQGSTIIWFWIGDHDEYMRRLQQP
jgi:hypothetical protein